MCIFCVFSVNFSKFFTQTRYYCQFFGEDFEFLSFCDLFIFFFWSSNKFLRYSRYLPEKQIFIDVLVFSRLLEIILFFLSIFCFSKAYPESLFPLTHAYEKKLPHGKGKHNECMCEEANRWIFDIV
jgi:hypothetical protein